MTQKKALAAEVKAEGRVGGADVGESAVMRWSWRRKEV